MIVKEAKEGQRVKTQYGIVIGVALEYIENGSMVALDKEVSFPILVGGFLKILPGIKAVKIPKPKGE